jgi:histidinol dehydrogenase
VIEIIDQQDKQRRRERLATVFARQVALDLALQREVAAIINDVREQGDTALIDYSIRFDGVSLPPTDLRVDERFLAETAARADSVMVNALREAIRNVRAFHEQEIQPSWTLESMSGSWVGQRISPIERVGVYVPGGSAAYPSSVIMNIVPAQVAGVAHIIAATPPGTLSENPAVAAALVELEITEVYRVGGAQAIAALAFGTATVPRVDKITGPGNQFVAAAKKLVYGVVGIDSIAGPSEVVIIADETAKSRYIAADLLAQAEHAEDACAILITPSTQLAQEINREVAAQVSELPRSAIIEKSLAQYGAIIVTENLDEACDLANELGPEHLQLMTRDNERVASSIRNAGAIFFGDYSPEAVGDYFAGPNHVLPTAGAARFSSALGVDDFIKRTSLINYSAPELTRAAPMIAALARAEGLEAHARSALIRTEED